MTSAGVEDPVDKLMASIESIDRTISPTDELAGSETGKGNKESVSEVPVAVSSAPGRSRMRQKPLGIAQTFTSTRQAVLCDDEVCNCPAPKDMPDRSSFTRPAR